MIAMGVALSGGGTVAALPTVDGSRFAEFFFSPPTCLVPRAIVAVGVIVSSASCQSTSLLSLAAARCFGL